MSKVIEINKLLEIETEELDYALVHDFIKDPDAEIIYRGDDNKFGESSPIKIEDIEKLIDRIKKAGCNYISFNYHSDHYQYILEGYKVETK